MPQIESPTRESDLPHSQDAVLTRTQEVLALARTPLSKVESINRGFFLELTTPLSLRFLRWWESLPLKEHHLWMDSAEIDLLGTQIFLSHELISRNPTNPFHRPIEKPFGCYAIVCSYRQAASAIAYLRREHLGPALLNAYGTDLFSVASNQIIDALELTEGSFNSLALPHYCRTRWGLVLRIDAPNVERVSGYFNVEHPADCSIPIVDDLGAMLSIVYAFSSGEEALRVALCPRTNESSTVHELGQWLLRSDPESTKPKKTLLKS
jgi:hypothetical protein